MLTFGIFIDAVLLVFGLVWCKHILARLPSDIAEFRASTQGPDRGVIAAFWVITLGVIYWIASFLVGLF